MAGASYLPCFFFDLTGTWTSLFRFDQPVIMSQELDHYVTHRACNYVNTKKKIMKSSPRMLFMQDVEHGLGSKRDEFLLR